MLYEVITIRAKNTFERINYNTDFSQDVTLRSYNTICLKNGNVITSYSIHYTKLYEGYIGRSRL